MTAPMAGRFRLIERVAAGGMGEVWRGVELGAGGVERPAAIKRIAPELQRHEELVRGFVDEARLSFRLCHANVVQVRDIGCEPGELFIAMEWVEGADLATVLERCRALGQPLPLRFAVLICAQAAAGLDYAHRLRSSAGASLHLVHRDVSPTNLLLSVEGEVKVTDFGIARFRERQTISVPGALKGKLAYMAPEQARGEELDARADVFALGVVLFEMATGHNPLGAEGEASEKELLDRLRRGDHPPPSRFAQLPAGLEAIVLRAMAPDREARYRSAAALREDLEGLARREAWSLSPATLGPFVRSVLSAEIALADTDRYGSPAVKKQPTPPPAARPFDAALGDGLLALGGAEIPRVTQAGKRSVEKPRTAIAHPVIAPEPAAAAAPPPGASQLASVVPKRARWWWLVAAVAIAALFALGLAQRAKPRTEAAPSIAAATVPARVTAPAPAPTPSAATRPAPAAAAVEPQHHPRHVRAAEAHLTVASDVRANVFIDATFIHEAPLTEWPLAPGTHRVRIEGTQDGLRLMPKQRTVILKPGESRRIEIDLLRSP